jgi:hypothetical protein
VLKVNFKHIYTVGQLKKVISSRHGHSVVALLYHGVCLADEHQLAHLIPDLLNMGAPRFSVRTRVLTEPKPGGISLHVKGLSEGSTFSLHLSAGSTVADLVTAIIDHEAYSSEADIQITCAGKNLSALDSSSTLKKCKLVSGSVVNVAGKLRGVYMATPVQTFVDMENISALKTCLVNGSNPIWRKVCRGLHVEGTCRNSFCEAFEEDVVSRKGFVVFNIAEVVHCPLCGSSFTPTTVGFRMCQWKFEGRKAGFHSIDMMSKWHTTNKKLKYQYFDDEGGRNMAEWCSLVITAKPLPDDEITGGMNMSLKLDKDCAICFGTLTTGSRISNNVDMACGHGAHSDCKKALQSSDYTSCPTCRGPIAA